MARVNLNVLALSYLFPNRAQPEYGIFVFNRLKAVQKYCHIRVIAPIQWYPLKQRLRPALWGVDIPFRDKLEEIDVYHPRFPVIPRYLKWFDSLSFFWVVRSVVNHLRSKESFEFDLIDVHWTYPDIVSGYLLARKFDKKYIVTVRGHEALYQVENTLRRRMVAHYLRKADFVVTLSDELKSRVLKLGVAPARVQTVLNGVDLSHFNVQNRAACRQQLDLPEDRKIILSVGRLTQGKGHHELVRIMPDLLRNDKVELYIIGGINPEDDFSHTLYTMVTDLGLTNVHFINKVEHDKLTIWYNAADLFCLASKGEGCPNVVLEALACGTPVVVTNVGAVSEFVVNSENGFLVDANALVSLTKVVRTALDKDWNRAEIASKMINSGWASCAKHVISIYQSVLGQCQEKLHDREVS